MDTQLTVDDADVFFLSWRFLCLSWDASQLLTIESKASCIHQTENVLKGGLSLAYRAHVVQMSVEALGQCITTSGIFF